MNDEQWRAVVARIVYGATRALAETETDDRGAVQLALHVALCDALTDSDAARPDLSDDVTVMMCCEYLTAQFARVCDVCADDKNSLT